MKKILYFLAVQIFTVLVIETILTSCQTPEQKVNDAKENVKDANQDLKNMQKAESEAEAQKAANAESWRVFKNESEAKIRNNELVIDEMNTKMHSSGKKIQAVFEKKIAELKQKNNAMKVRVNNFENNQSDWESFKREYNHDMDELGRALKDFTVNNRK